MRFKGTSTTEALHKEPKSLATPLHMTK